VSRNGTFNCLQAINRALDEELARDDKVLLIGEDLVVWGGPYGACRGLAEKYPDRVLATPISEGGFVGTAVGAAATGLRPVVELMFSDFLGVCLEPIMNGAAKLRYITGGQFAVPLVIRTTIGAGHSLGATHNQTLYALLAHIPGLKLLAPATPGDAYGLLKAAIRSEDPVVIFEHKMLYFRPKTSIEIEDEIVPIGKAIVHRAGDDVTVVAISRAVHTALEAAERLSAEGASVEVIDLRTLVPLDIGTIRRSVAKTGRLVVVDEATPVCSIGSEIVSRTARECFSDLRIAPLLYAGVDSPVPFSPELEAAHIPSADGLVERVRTVLDG
jgi:pyruvate dehydrogenase E1 component beta subunit